MTNVVMPCQYIRIQCFKPASGLPIGLVVQKRGQIINENCKIGYAIPTPCVIVPYTKVEKFTRCDVETEELKENILLKLRYYKSTSYLIYPKESWEKIEKKYLNPMIENRPPREPGALLYGPPGTGKSSLLEMIGDYLGVYTVKILSGDLVSPYFGESEQKLQGLLLQAEGMEPSAIIFDDFEWLFRGRKFAGDRGAHAQAVPAMMQIILNKLQEWKNEQRKIVMFVATNINPDTLDVALTRSGRMGRRPIFVPLPNFEAVHTYLTLYDVPKLIGEKETEDLAKKLVNLGLCMADVKDVKDSILEGIPLEKIDLSPKGGRGYVRPIPEIIASANEMLFSVIDNRLVKPEIVLRDKHTKLVAFIESQLGEPLFVQYLVNKAIPTIVLKDERHFDEAVYTAETTRAVLIVPVDYIHKEVVINIYKNVATPTLFIGKSIPSQIRGKRIFSTSMVDKSYRLLSLTKIVLNYYGIRVDEKSLEEIISLHGSERDKILEFLAELGTWGRKLEPRDVIKELKSYLKRREYE